MGVFRFRHGYVIPSCVPTAASVYTHEVQALAGSRSGQAVVEYILMLLVALSMATALMVSLKRIRSTFMMQVVCEVAAPCPTCAPAEEVREAARRRSPQACKE